MPGERRWGLICLGPACMLSLLVGACWDKLSYLLQGTGLDKVRGSEQPDVVSSCAEWFVWQNSCFLPVHSETLELQPGYWLLVNPQVPEPPAVPSSVALWSVQVLPARS